MNSSTCQAKLIERISESTYINRSHCICLTSEGPPSNGGILLPSMTEAAGEKVTFLCTLLEFLFAEQNMSSSLRI